MNLSKICELINNVDYAKCGFTQDIFFGGITNNWSQKIIDSGGRVESEYYYVGPIIHYYDYILKEGEDTFCKWELNDMGTSPISRRWLKEKTVPYRKHRDNITKFIKYLVKNYGIVSININEGPPKFDDGHCFVLVNIGEEIYIIDSYASIDSFQPSRRSNIRKFDSNSFSDYITYGTLDSYNKTFETCLQEGIGLSPEGTEISISVTECFNTYNKIFGTDFQSED